MNNNGRWPKTLKSTEIIIKAREARVKAAQPPPSSPNKQQVTSLKVLGVDNRLTATDHVNSLLASFSSLQHVSFVSFAIMTYHSRPYTTCFERSWCTVRLQVWLVLGSRSGRLDSFLRRCKIQHFSITDLPSVTEIFSDADNKCCSEYFN